jgi:hypothetical protein
MHPYLTKLGVPPAVQDFFEPYYITDAVGNLIFSYGDEAEHFGFAFHRVPAKGLWQAGNPNTSMIRQVFYCDSAMEAISFLSLNYAAYAYVDQLLFLAGETERSWPRKKSYSMVFSQDILGRIRDLKVAAAIRRLPVSVNLAVEFVHIRFRQQNYTIAQDEFSLAAFEKISKYRFNVKTHKAKNADSWLDQLKTSAF